MLDVVKHDSIVIFLNALQGKMLTFIAKHLQVCNNTGQGVGLHEPSASSDIWVEREALWEEKCLAQEHNTKYPASAQNPANLSIRSQVH